MSNNKQQTAVEWFLDQLIEHRIIIVDKTTYQVKYKHEILLEQAKAMHKEEMVDFAMKFMMQDRPVVTFYNETFNNNEQH